jgi:hypothetical protein
MESKDKGKEPATDTEPEAPHEKDVRNYVLRNAISDDVLVLDDTLNPVDPLTVHERTEEKFVLYFVFSVYFKTYEQLKKYSSIWKPIPFPRRGKKVKGNVYILVDKFTKRLLECGNMEINTYMKRKETEEAGEVRESAEITSVPEDYTPSGIKSIYVHRAFNTKIRIPVVCHWCGKMNPRIKCSKCSFAMWCGYKCMGLHWNDEHKFFCDLLEDRSHIAHVRPEEGEEKKEEEDNDKEVSVPMEEGEEK